MRGRWAVLLLAWFAIACGGQVAPSPSASIAAPTVQPSPTTPATSSGSACEPSPGGYGDFGGELPDDAPSTVTLGPTSGIVVPTPSHPPVPLVVHGTVVDASCSPVTGAFVWTVHRDPDGNYGPPDATSDDFYYEGVARTDAAGRFEFITVRPGGDGGPSHMHVAVIAAGRSDDFDTEIWFADEDLPPTHEQAVVASPFPSGAGVAIDVQLVLRDE